MEQKSGLKKSQDQKLNLKLKKQLNQIVAPVFEIVITIDRP